MIEVIVYPTSVQGAAAAAEIVAAIGLAAARRECDALIVCRGGGSIEDLWPFNEEAVARAIAACPIPIVSGVGHETDFTIADFVADRRAATPTAAAELLSPNRAALLDSLTAQRSALKRSTQRLFERLMQSIDHARRGLLSPVERVARERERHAALRGALRRSLESAFQVRQWQLAHAGQALRARSPDLARATAQVQLAAERLTQARRRRLDSLERRLAQGRDALEHLNPQRILERGYSIVQTGSGEIVRDALQVPAGSRVTVQLAQGRVAASVDEVLDQGNTRGIG